MIIGRFFRYTNHIVNDSRIHLGDKLLTRGNLYLNIAPSIEP
jgi:hypothetical protein